MHRRQRLHLLGRPASAPGRVRLIAASVALAVVAGAGLADYSSGSSDGYVVRAGDTLWAIASAHGISVATLAAANHLDPAAVLPIGRHLYVPGIPSVVEAAATSPASSTARSGGAVGSFCSSFVASPEPTGVLPDVLAGSPDRLALRPLFRQWATHYGISTALLEALDWQESGWQQSVVSATGAVGVGQIMPGTATFVSSVLVGEPLNVQSVSDNIRMSAAFLAYLSRVEGGSLCATVAAYYEGPLSLSAHGVYASTRAYVSDVEALLPRFE